MDICNILVVEDDRNISDLIRMYLEKEGFDVRIAADGGKAVEEYDRQAPDMVLLDIMLPGEDGITILRRLRAAPDTARVPVILLTAKNTEYDKVVGLDTGADDYIPKPFGMMEFISRVKAVLRRGGSRTEETLVHGPIQIRIQRHEVLVHGQKVELTLKEFELLKYLVENRGIVLTRDQLLTRIWGYDFDGETRTVDVHVRTLRQKLGEAGACIETVRGVGYRMGDEA